MLRTYHPLQKSHYGHYFVSYVEGFIRCDTGARSVTHENTIYIQAATPKAALKAAFLLASKTQDDFTGEDGFKYRIEFLGITNIAPIHEKMNSGSEVGWLDLTGIDIETLNERVAGKTLESAYDHFDSITEEQSEYPPWVKPSLTRRSTPSTEPPRC